MSSLAPADYAVITGFFVVMAAIGIYFRKRMLNVKIFFGGGKEVPWWLAGISFYMCSFSALAFVMYSALAYKYGWVSVTIFWVTVPSIFLGAVLFASRWRRAAQVSPLEYIEYRFGNKMRQGLVWLGLPLRVIDDGMKLLAVGTIVAVALGFDIKTAIIASGVIMISYTFLGGLWAALTADFIQFIILLGGVIVLPFLVLSKVGGPANFINNVPDGFFNLINGDYNWFYIGAFFVNIFLGYNTSWTLVQRYYSVGSDKDARKVGYLVAFLSFISPPIFFLPAMVGRVLLPDIPPEGMNEIYALVCKMVLPVGMLGMIVAAMFSATMSSLAGEFNAIASVLTNDLYKRMISPKASEKKLMIIARTNTLIVGLAVISITLIIQNVQGSQDLFNMMVKVFSIFIPPTAIPMLMGMLTKRVSNTGGLSGLLSGMAAGLITFVLGGFYPFLRLPQFIIPITSVVTLLAIFIATAIRPDSPSRRQKVEDFFKKIESDDIEAVSADTTSQKQKSPLSIIGFGVMAIGIILIVSVLATVALSESILSLVVGASMIGLGVIFQLLARRANKADIKV